MQYSFKLQILKREDEDKSAEDYICIQSPRWYGKIFNAAVAVIWAMRELKEKVRGKEDV
jgi:hypothetical protein